MIINNPREEMRDVTVLVIHDHETEFIFPSSGIFEERLNLIPSSADITIGNARGIILTGYIENVTLNDFSAEFRILIKYTNSLGEEITIIYRHQI